jgi:maleylpyruvate isomerase
VPHDRLAGVCAGHCQLSALAARLDESTVRRPSLLPGWTVGHLLTHLARNADSHAGMVEAAGRGEAVRQYPGGDAQREGDIAAGAGRSAEQLVTDLVDAQHRLERAWDATHVGTWRTGYGLTASRGPVSLADLVLLRWREVEVHAVDLGLVDHGGPSWDELAPAYVDAEWQWSVAHLPGRLEPGTSLLLAPGDRTSAAAGSDAVPLLVEAPTSEILRWLAGRGGDPSWPRLSRWT